MNSLKVHGAILELSSQQFLMEVFWCRLKVPINLLLISLWKSMAILLRVTAFRRKTFTTTLNPFRMNITSCIKITSVSTMSTILTFSSNKEMFTTQWKTLCHSIFLSKEQLTKEFGQTPSQLRNIWDCSLEYLQASASSSYSGTLRFFTETGGEESMQESGGNDQSRLVLVLQ